MLTSDKHRLTCRASRAVGVSQCGDFFASIGLFDLVVLDATTGDVAARIELPRRVGNSSVPLFVHDDRSIIFPSACVYPGPVATLKCWGWRGGPSWDREFSVCCSEPTMSPSTGLLYVRGQSTSAPPNAAIFVLDPKTGAVESEFVVGREIRLWGIAAERGVLWVLLRQSVFRYFDLSTGSLLSELAPMPLRYRDVDGFGDKLWRYEDGEGFQLIDSVTREPLRATIPQHEDVKQIEDLWVVDGGRICLAWASLWEPDDWPRSGIYRRCATVVLDEHRDLPELLPDFVPVHSSPDSPLVFLKGDGIQIHQFSRKCRQVDPPSTGHFGTVIPVAWSDDGRRFVTADSHGGVVCWSADMYTSLWQRKLDYGCAGAVFHPNSYDVHAITFSEDVSRFSADGELVSTKRLKMWSAELPHRHFPLRAAGTSLCVICRFGSPTTIDLDTYETCEYDDEFGRCHSSYGGTALLNRGLIGVCMSREDIEGVDDRDDYFRVFELVTLTHVSSTAIDTAACCASWSDTLAVVACDEPRRAPSIQMVDVLAGRVVASGATLEDKLVSIVAMPNRSVILTGSGEGEILIWSDELELRARFATKWGEIGHLCLTPDQSQVFASCADGAVHVIDVDRLLAGELQPEDVPILVLDS